MAERYRDQTGANRVLRDRLREEIREQVAHFLRDGGRIEVLGTPRTQTPPRCGAWRELPDSVIGLG